MSKNRSYYIFEDLAALFPLFEDLAPPLAD